LSLPYFSGRLMVIAWKPCAFKYLAETDLVCVMQGPNKGMPDFYVGVKKDLHTVTCQSPMCYRHVKVSAFLRLEEQLTVPISKNTYTDSQSIYTEWL
jgi:hypothetical protein